MLILGHVLGDLSGVYIIEGKTITEEEKSENMAKLDVWFDNFIETWGPDANGGRNL